MEDAAIDPDLLKGSRTGVYAGVGSTEFRDLIAARGQDDSYLGTTASVAVGRVAFALGLEGPAMPVDMACASSLAAVHQAVAALQRGDVDLALAGGVNATLSQAFVRFHKDIGMLSAAGYCSPFDASANGYVRGEGCGVVVLRRLSEAEADGDRIWAVIRGSAVNQNGASAALTVPNGPAQERVMEEALTKSGVSPSNVDYLEAHAVGSQLGDLIELNAVASVYGRERDRERPLLVGSVKSNIGHIEWAAGIAAFIKTVLSMNKGVIPENLHLETPNPNVEWDQIPVRVTSDKTDWPAVSGRRPLAGVNAFGLSGTNAHVLIEGYEGPSGALPASTRTPLPTGAPKPMPLSLPEPVDDFPMSGEGLTERTTRLLPISGKSEEALRDLAKRYLSWLDGQEGSSSDETLSDLAWTAGVGRSHFPQRAGLVFHDAEQLRVGLRALVNAEATDGAVPHEATEVAFPYTGQSSRWLGMGEVLYQSEPVARAVLDRCEELIRQERGTSLLHVMFGPSGVEHDPNDPAWVQPTIYALECALAAQWASVGIRPSAVVGHGSGALSAAQASGVFGLEEGLRLAAALGDLANIGLKQDAQATLEGLEVALADLKVAAPNVSLVNSVTGRVVESGGALDVDHWLRQVREPVEIFGCAKTLAQLGVGLVVNIGPNPGLGRRLSEAWPMSTETPSVLSTLESPRGEGETPESDDGFVRAVAGAYEAGLEISFSGLFAGEARRRISIPTYPFQRRRYWI